MPRTSRLLTIPTAFAAAALLLSGIGPANAIEEDFTETLAASAPAGSAESGRVPFYGVNANQHLHRLVGTTDPRYVKALPAIKDLLATVVRSAIVCPTAAGSGIPRDLLPVSKQNDCQAYSDQGGVDDVVAVGRFATDLAPVQVAPLVQISYPVNAGMTASADLAWRADYYERLGVHLGRTLGGRAPYFELGNEPDSACIALDGQPTGLPADDYDAACVARVRASILALQKGVRSAFPNAVFAVGTSGMRWGITDALWNGIDPDTGRATEPTVRWDYTAVHWYYRDGFNDTVGSPADTHFGFHNPRDISAKQSLDPGAKNPAATYRDKYGVPLLITEFGVNTQYTDPESKITYAFASPANRVNSFGRLLNGLYRDAEEYNIAGLTAFALTDEPASATASGEYGLARWDTATTGYITATDSTRPWAAYRAFIAANPALDHGKLRVDSPTNGQVLPANTNPVVFAGAGHPGWRVAVAGTASGHVLCTVIVTPAGAWTCPLGTTLGNGTFLLTTTQTSPDETTVSAGIGLSIHIGPYAPAVVTSPTTLKPGAAPEPAFIGTGQPGLTITVTGNSGRLICTSTVTTGGSWSCIPGFAMPAGSYISYLQQSIDTPTRLDYRLITPTATTLSAPAANDHILTAAAALTSSATPTFGGKATPATGVSVKGSSGRVLCVAVSTATGDWSCTSTVPLARGSYTGTAVQDIPWVSPAAFAFSVVVKASVTTPADGGSLTPLRPRFEGVADPGSTIQVQGNSGRTICVATPNASTGTWACASQIDLVVGSYTSFLKQRVGTAIVYAPPAFRYTVEN